MTDPKRRDPAALRAHQRQRQAGGPHDEGRTRGEEERMAIDESLRADLREGLLRDELERSEAELDRLAAENAAWRELAARMLPEVESNMGLVAGLTDVIRDMLDGVSSGDHSGDRLAAENAELRAKLERVEGQMRNVMLLAQRMKRRGATHDNPRLVENGEHLLRFCAAAGVEPSILRAALDGGDS